jgi:integrase/recombinase XerD
MVETLFSFRSALQRQVESPLLKEREEYLTFLLNQGISRPRVRTIATMLLHVIRIMEIDRVRIVKPNEIENAMQSWGKDLEHHKTRKPGPTSWQSFRYSALNWFRFQNMIEVLPQPSDPVKVICSGFYEFMASRGMLEGTIRIYASRIEPLLRWALLRRESLASISIREVDEYLDMKQTEGLLPRTIASYCVVLRLFFRYAELRGFNDYNVARGIRNPRVARYDPLRKGPPWKEVRALLTSDVPDRPADLRASAMLFLCSIYGLRSSEVVKLTLDDFDWVKEIFVVRRAKRGRIQQFPIQFEVGNAILKYLQHCRPRCSCRNLFVTLNAPYKPVRSATLWTIIANRVRRTGFNLKAGAHAFRHACATELLRKGSSLKEIADFLGHRDLESVSIYAKADIQALRKVAAFSLGGVI